MIGIGESLPLLAGIDWGRVAGFLCLAAIVVAVLIVTGGNGPNFPNAHPPDD